MTDVRPRKRAVQDRSRATVAAVLEATARILGEDGLDAVTTNAVADRAGVSVGSLYQYYPNRDAILADLLRGKLEALLDEMRVAVGQPTFKGAVRAMLGALSRSYIERPALASALAYVETLVGDDEEVGRLRAALGRTTVDFLAAHDVPDPQTAARDVIALSRGMALAAGQAGESDHEMLLDRMERAVLGYLKV